MAIVAILLVNMLIAMMGNTYQKIAETRNEWQRQVNTNCLEVICFKTKKLGKGWIPCFIFKYFF